MKQILWIAVLTVCICLVLGFGAIAQPATSPISPVSRPTLTPIPDAQGGRVSVVEESNEAVCPAPGATFDSMWMGQYPLWVQPDGTYCIEGWEQ